MDKLSEDISKSVLYNEFRKKLPFELTALLKQRSDMSSAHVTDADRRRQNE
jgi:hypothetical protein